MNLGDLITKRYVLALAITATAMFLVGMLSAQADAASSGGIGTADPAPSAEDSGDTTTTTHRVMPLYERLWDGFSPRDHRWAHSTSECESGGNPRAIGGGGAYRGKYQFSFGTWASVGGKGDPARASEAEQDRRAAMLLTRSGRGHWPVCG